MTAHARDVLDAARRPGGAEPSSAPEARPLVLIAFRDHWTGALVHAELLERGHDAACAGAVAAAVVTSTRANLARASVIVVEDATLSSPHDRAALAWLRALDPTRTVVLLTSATADVADGPWDMVLRRPITIAQIADVVEQLVDAGDAPASRAPEPSRARPPPEGFEVRVALPWPMVRCRGCLASRHCEVPRTPAAKGTVIAAVVTFGLEHDACGRGGGPP